jgi:hypothetical protein
MSSCFGNVRRESRIKEEFSCNKSKPSVILIAPGEKHGRDQDMLLLHVSPVPGFIKGRQDQHLCARRRHRNRRQLIGSGSTERTYQGDSKEKGDSKHALNVSGLIGDAR